MTTELTNGYKLTTEHSASSYGQPVLLVEGEVYGPGDLIEFYGLLMRAREAVVRQADVDKRLSNELVMRFTGN